MMPIMGLEEFTKIYTTDKRSLEILSEVYNISVYHLCKLAKHYGMNRSRRKTAPDKEILESMIENGMTRKEIAEEFKFSPFTVDKYITKYDIEVDFKHKNSKEIDIAEMTRLRVESLWSFNELAELYQVSGPTIQNRCREFDVEKVIVKRQGNDWRLASSKSQNKVAVNE